MGRMNHTAALVEGMSDRRQMLAEAEHLAEATDLYYLLIYPEAFSLTAKGQLFLLKQFESYICTEGKGREKCSFHGFRSTADSFTANYACNNQFYS